MHRSGSRLLECPLYCWSDGEVDRQLDLARTARWLSGLVDTLHLMCGNEGFDPAAEVPELHRIARRFLGAAS